MNRRSLLQAFAATASGLLLPIPERVRTYSFLRAPTVIDGHDCVIDCTGLSSVPYERLGSRAYWLGEYLPPMLGQIDLKPGEHHWAEVASIIRQRVAEFEARERWC
jgi:hypothetical protein